jgi:putative transposase
MARLASVVVPCLPHHITERGNRRQQTFFSDSDYEAYRNLMAEWCADCGVGHWWQGRFTSFVMDKRHLLSAAR